MFKIPLIINIIALVAAFLIGGWPAAITVLILTIIEVSFSFDNAVVNAKILKKMDEKWQKIFLTVGILIAVFGMRLLFPLIVVSLAAHISPWGALHLAVSNPGEYAHHILAAHGSIAAFGGLFLFMLFITWLLEEKEVHWTPIEKWLSKTSYPPAAGYFLALILLMFVPDHYFWPGVLGAGTFFLVSRLDSFMENTKILSAGFGTFLYLEVLDASFSFDGVVGAFAITTNIFLIALGLGIGAAYIRSMTVYLTRKGTLSEFIYLEHGAHWAIGALSILLIVSISHEISDIITGLVGVSLIIVAFVHSLKERRKTQKIPENTIESKSLSQKT